MSQDWTALLFQHAAAFLRRVCIVSGADAAVTKNYDLVIVTAGARQIPGENRLNLLQTNVPLYRKIVPSVAEHSLEALLLVVSTRRRAHLRRLETLQLLGQPRHRLRHQPRLLPLQVPYRQSTSTSTSRTCRMITGIGGGAHLNLKRVEKAGVLCSEDSNYD